MAATSRRAGRPSLFRRRILLVEGFQLRFIVSQLFWLAMLLVVLSGIVMTPSVMAMLGPDDARRAEAADRFLAMHGLVWPLVLAFFVMAGAVSVVMTHRVAGPLYRFRRVFEEVGRGVLTARVRTRRGDYLTLEAAVLDRMITDLREQALNVQGTVGALCAAAERASAAAGVSASAREGLSRAIDAARDAAGRFVTAAPRSGTDDLSTTTTTSAGPAGERRTRRPTQDGFTLIEVLLAVGMVVVIMSIAAPAYARALEAARVTRAIGDITAIDREVRLHMLSNGCLPSDLAAIGRSTTVDPWGRPYVYGALSKSGGGSGGGRGGGGGAGAGSSCGACAGGCLTAGAARKDRRLVPINSDFDLYSLGRDGATAAALTAATSLDDVVRGSDGGFVGLGRNY